jgi:hypothetical protein
MPKHKNGVMPRRFKNYWPGLKGTPVLMTCKQISKECQEYIWGNNKFKCDDALTLRRLPPAMGEHLQFAQRISIKMHLKWIVNPAGEWPRAMKFIAEEIPADATIKFWTRFPETSRHFERQVGIADLIKKFMPWSSSGAP